MLRPQTSIAQNQFWASTGPRLSLSSYEDASLNNVTTFTASDMRCAQTDVNLAANPAYNFSIFSLHIFRVGGFCALDACCVFDEDVGQDGVELNGVSRDMRGEDHPVEAAQRAGSGSVSVTPSLAPARCPAVITRTRASSSMKPRARC